MTSQTATCVAAPPCVLPCLSVSESADEYLHGTAPTMLRIIPRTRVPCLPAMRRGQSNIPIGRPLPLQVTSKFFTHPPVGGVVKAAARRLTCTRLIWDGLSAIRRVDARTIQQDVTLFVDNPPHAHLLKNICSIPYHGEDPQIFNFRRERGQETNTSFAH